MDSISDSPSSTRSYSPWRIIKAPEDFDYPALLRQSIADAEILEMQDDIDVTPDDVDVTPSSAPAQATEPAKSSPLNSSFQAQSIGSPCAQSTSEGMKSTSGYGLKTEAPSCKKKPIARGSKKQVVAPCSKKKRKVRVSQKQAEIPGTPGIMRKCNQRRQKRREAEKVEHGHRPSAAAFEKYVLGAPTIPAGIDSANLPTTAGGYGSKNRPADANSRTAFSKEELVEQRGFTPIDWNGIDPLLVVDQGDRVCVALVGQPKKENYKAAAQSLHETLVAEGAATGLTERATPHNRGHFAAINVGAMHGKGTVNPINLNTKGREATVARLLKNPHVRQLAAFASYSLSLFAPKLYKETRRQLNDLYDNTPGLKRLFPAHVSIFPTAAFNLGPNVWTYQHRDNLNLAYAWCAIQALGNFDPKKGGHLILWELRLVIEFPPAALVLIPSATITHSNIPVAEGDTRSSFTQYMPGGLFRWVDYGYSLVEDCKAKNPELYNKQEAARPYKWQKGLDLLTTVYKLEQDSEHVGVA